jgi:hypothetical protein
VAQAGNRHFLPGGRKSVFLTLAAKSAHFPAPRFPRDFPRAFRALSARFPRAFRALSAP